MHDAILHDEVVALLERYYLHGDRSSVTVYRGAVQSDGRPEYVASMLERTEPHDDDYRIFRAFIDDQDVILDIGANWGYSVGSIWACGATTRVVSFEPLTLYSACLERIVELRPGRFDYRTVALGAMRGRLRFVVPVVNGTALTALTSADPSPYLVGLCSNIVNHITEWMPDLAGHADVKLYEFESCVEMLDDVLATEVFDFPINQISAIKVDVEGLEDQVIQGALGTIAKFMPLIMAEGGNRNERLVRQLEPLGYFYTERQGDVLVPVKGITESANGFFLHPDHCLFYRDAGIYAD